MESWKERKKKKERKKERKKKREIIKSCGWSVVHLKEEIVHLTVHLLLVVYYHYSEDHTSYFYWYLLLPFPPLPSSLFIN